MADSITNSNHVRKLIDHLANSVIFSGILSVISQIVFIILNTHQALKYTSLNPGYFLWINIIWSLPETKMWVGDSSQCVFVRSVNVETMSVFIFVNCKRWENVSQCDNYRRPWVLVTKWGYLSNKLKSVLLSFMTHSFLNLAFQALNYFTFYLIGLSTHLTIVKRNTYCSDFTFLHNNNDRKTISWW